MKLPRSSTGILLKTITRTYISFRLSQHSPIPVLTVSYFPRTTNQCELFLKAKQLLYIQLYYSLYTASYTLPTTRKNGARPYDKRKKRNTRVLLLLFRVWKHIFLKSSICIMPQLGKTIKNFTIAFFVKALSSSNCMGIMETENEECSLPIPYTEGGCVCPQPMRLLASCTRYPLANEIKSRLSQIGTRCSSPRSCEKLIISNI